MYANNAGTGYANANIFYLFLGAQPQWGNLWAGYTEVLNWYFPLTTSQVYAVCLTKHTKNISSGHNWEPARIEEWNNSYARIHPDGDLGYSVIAICKAQQQWGYGNSESTQTFPIKFTNSVIGIYGSKRAINYEYTFAATSITNTNFFMSTRNSEGSSRVIACNWLAIGQQQTK